MPRLDRLAAGDELDHGLGHREILSGSLVRSMRTPGRMRDPACWPALRDLP